MSEFIADSAEIINSTRGENIRMYRNARLIDSACGANVSIGEESTVVKSELADYVSINRRNYIRESRIGEFTTIELNANVLFSDVGKYTTISRAADIGATEHDYKKVTTFGIEKVKAMRGGVYQEFNFTNCKIGNDVWIGAGAQVLKKANVGDGACIGAGAIVTKDVPPYAIVVGVPAKILKYRFEEKFIEDLLKIKWWDWPQDVVIKNFEFLTSSNINAETIEKLKEIAATL